MQDYQEEYFVEKILAKRDYPDKTYLIKWENWDLKDSTWEPIENLTNALDLVDEFEKNLAIKNYEKKNKIEREYKKTIRNFYESDDEEEVKPNFLNGNKRKKNSDIEEQEFNYREYKSYKIKKPKKTENILNKFPNNEHVDSIKTVKLIKDLIHCLVEWRPQSTGLQMEDCFVPSSILGEKVPNLLIDFYESKIKFI